MLRPEDSYGVDYPTILRDSKGNFVENVNSDQKYRYVGNLKVTFDEDGHIISVDPRSGPVATPTIQTAFEKVGTAEQPLNEARADVRGRGINLGRLAADSNLWYGP
jgi:2',3'-cyclic-nucleotide 2'-phosphodiesterase (5'-nucleotidase family)